MIVVAKLIRLGKNGDKFDKKLIAEEMRSNAKIERDYVEQFNKNWQSRGQMYVINEEATAKRDAELSKKQSDPETPENNEREQVKQLADDLGIEYPKNMPTSRLKELIEEKSKETEQ